MRKARLRRRAGRANAGRAGADDHEVEMGHGAP
jgi:hypothetical protein